MVISIVLFALVTFGLAVWAYLVFGLPIAVIVWLTLNTLLVAFMLLRFPSESEKPVSAGNRFLRLLRSAAGERGD